MESHFLGFRRFNPDTSIGLDESATFSIALEVQAAVLGTTQRAIGAREISTKQKPASRDGTRFRVAILDRRP